MFDILQLNDMLVPELKELAEQLGLKGYKRLNKQELIYKILDEQALAGEGDEKSEKKSRPEKANKKTKNENGADDSEEESQKDRGEKRKRTRKRVNKDYQSNQEEDTPQDPKAEEADPPEEKKDRDYGGKKEVLYS